MKSAKEVLSKIEEVSNICATLIKIGNIFAESNDPSLRALAYEIGISVTNITEEANSILKQLNKMFPEKDLVYDVLSPDGFSISRDETWPTEEAARAAMMEWAKRYEQQGYYSTGNRYRIPVNELPSHCKIITLDGNLINANY